MKKINFYEPYDIITGDEYIRTIKTIYIENVPHLKWSPIKQNISPIWKGKQAKELLELGNEIISGELPLSNINFGKDYETEIIWKSLDEVIGKNIEEVDFTVFSKKDIFNILYSNEESGRVVNTEILFLFNKKVITDWYYL